MFAPDKETLQHLFAVRMGKREVGRSRREDKESLQQLFAVRMGKRAGTERPVRELELPTTALH